MGIKVLGGLIVLAVLGAGLLGFVVLPEATIEIAPRTEATTRDFEIAVDQNQAQADAESLTIPGKILEQEMEGAKTYPSTGAKNMGKKASGFVTIYNFSKTNLILKDETTVLSAANGNRYYFTQDVGNIRPTALIGLENQEIDPSSLIPPVPVVAEGPGEAYNLPAGTRLEIANEAFGKQPEILYAVAAENLSGGTTQEVKIVSAGDIAAAFAALNTELINEARQELLSQGANLRLLDSAVSSEVLSQQASVVVGTEGAEFSVSQKLKMRALVYSEDDILSVVLSRIKRLLPENKALLEEKNFLPQSRFLSLSLDQGSGILAAHFEGQIIYRIEGEDLKPKLAGKSVEEMREILLSRPEIQEVTIRFYPFWVKTAPKFTSKIYLDIID